MTLDWQALADELGRRFDAVICPLALKLACLQAPPCEEWDCWSEASRLVWLKQRVAETGALRAGEKGAPPVRITSPLHVGFLYLEETDEMLTRLRNEVVSPEPALPTTSRIFSSNLVPTPIDRVAARVALGGQDAGSVVSGNK